MGVGKLFEPSSFPMNKIVSQRGWTIFGRSVWAYIGVDDSDKEGHYVRTHRMFSRILNFLFAIVILRKKMSFSLKNSYIVIL